MGGTVLILRTRPTQEDAWSAELESLGYSVLTAEDPGQGLVHVRTARVDVVIVDSVGDGPVEGAFAAFLRRLHEVANAPPFVLVSGSPMAPAESARLGSAAFVPKPCSPTDLDLILCRMGRPRTLRATRRRPTTQGLATAG